MWARRWASGAMAVLALLSAAAGALAASPKKGAKFTGTAKGRVTFATSFIAKEPLSFTTSSSGSQLLSFAYTDKVCGLAASPVVHVGAIKVGAGGKFSVSKRKSAPVPDALQSGRKVVTTTTISGGTFVSAKKATGTLQYQVKETGGGSCGPIRLKFSVTTP